MENRLRKVTQARAEQRLPGKAGAGGMRGRPGHILVGLEDEGSTVVSRWCIVRKSGE